MADVGMRCKYSAKNKSLTFVLDGEVWDAFVAGKTNFELYLPKTPTWADRIFEVGWGLKPSLKNKKVAVVRGRNEKVCYVEITSSTVRWVPLRRFERTGVHIVLHTKKK